MRPFGFALLVIGLLLGPAYFVYAKFFSGVAVGSYALRAGPGGFDPVSVALAPEASPVRVVLRLSVQYGPSKDGPSVPRNRYQAVATRDGAPVAEHSFELVANSVESSFQEFTWDFATLQVTKPGDYRLTLRETAPPEMQVISAYLNVRRTVLEPDLRGVWAGAGLIGLAALLVFLGP